MSATDSVLEVTGDARPDRSELAAFHERSRWRPMVEFGAVAMAWITLLGVGLWTDEWLVRAAMSVPLALASGQLFTYAHDAAHGSFSPSPTANAIVGRLALIPSWHVFGLWRAHHNMHHRFTNLRGRDFVWTPLSVPDYEQLGSAHRALHRFYRNRLGIGLGVHYAIEIWIPRMLFPRRTHRLMRRRQLLFDTLLFYGMIATVGYLGYRFVVLIDAERSGDFAFWISVLLLLLALPLLGTQWLIGFVIYLNHTHPDIVWYDRRVDWADRPAIQLESSAAQRFPKWTQALLPHRIMNHTAHHVDPRVPLRHLAEAQQHLTARYGTRFTSYDWSMRGFRDVLTRCKLYDYEARRWLSFDGIPTEPS